jgi:hypothetical protein
MPLSRAALAFLIALGCFMGCSPKEKKYSQGIMPVALNFYVLTGEIIRLRDEVKEVDATSLENLPRGLDGGTYQFVDLDGEGVSGILTEQAHAWFYKPNLGEGRFGPVQEVRSRPSLANLSGGRQQLLDLAGDGQLDFGGRLKKDADYRHTVQ